MKITSVMVMTTKAQVLRLHRQYGGVSPSVSMKDMRSVFHKRSLEHAPQDWYTDPIYAKVFKQSMTEVLSTDDRGGAFPIVQVMSKVKTVQPKGYEFDVYLSRSGQPIGLMQMVPSQKEAHLRFGDISAIDSQDKAKNSYGWVGMFPSGWNGNNKLVSYCDAITLESDDRWMSWVIRTMSKFSGRPLESIKIIPCDLGPSPDNIKDNVPGDFSFPH